MVGMHYNLDRSRCFYVTLLDLAGPKKSHREIGELLNTGNEQKKSGTKKATKAFGFMFLVI